MDIEKQLELEKERTRLLRGQVLDLGCVIRKLKRQVTAYKGHYTRAKGGLERTMKPKEEWREKYIKRLQKGAWLTFAEAEDAFNAGLSDHDYAEDPEDAADEELSYWGD